MLYNICWQDKNLEDIKSYKSIRGFVSQDYAEQEFYHKKDNHSIFIAWIEKEEDNTISIIKYLKGGK